MRTDDMTPQDDEVGRDLRDAYRSIATETAPPHLDEAVLAAAASAATPARKGLWQWRRPLAWATMIGLSFAIVLEFNQTGIDGAPKLEEALPAATPPDLEKAEPASPADDAARGNASSFAPQGVQREFDKDEARQVLERSLAVEAEASKRARDEELEAMSAPAAAELRESAEMPLRSVAPAAATLSPEAGELTDAAQGLSAGAEQRADRLLKASAAEEAACDDSTRADPERWRDCIRALVEAKRLDEARLESSLFREAFPDEPAPIPVE